MRRALTAADALACFLALAGLWALCPLSQAQDTSQVCLSAFVDDNGDGKRDSDEAPIEHGIAASLLNENDVTIAATLLEDSPDASDGLLCFDQVPAGSYRLMISSSEYAATGDASADVLVQPGAPPPKIDFSMSPLASSANARIMPRLLDLDSAALRSLLPILAALILVSVMMILLGCLLFFGLARRRRSNTPPSPSGHPSQSAPPLFNED